MTQNHALSALAYYTAFSEKNIPSMDKYLHPEVQFTGPLATLSGKAAVLEASKNFSAFFKTLKIRSTLTSENQAMVVYDLNCPPPVGNISASALLTFQENLIVKIELFYDARPFEKKKDEIFTTSGTRG